MTARKRKRRQRAVSIRPKRDLIDRLTRELARAGVVPSVIEQTAVAFSVILRGARRR